MSGYQENLKWFIVTAAFILCFAFNPPQAQAEDGWSQKQKLHAPDGAAVDYYGFSVCISGDYAIVGAIFDDDKGLSSGSAYAFQWNGSSWIQQTKLTASDGAASDYFGKSIAVSGDYAVIGANGDDSTKGSAYIFKWNGTSWIQQQKLTASDGAANDYFGSSVSISGDYAVIGAYLDDSTKGSAYIFKWNGTSWIQQQTLTASDAAANDYFGFSVSISGDRVIVGAYSDDDKGANSGSAYIFQWNGSNWIQQAKLTALDGAATDYFGLSVSISGDYAIVGADLDDGIGTDSGSAYIFQWNGSSWIQQTKLTASDGAAADQFGWSVSISGDYAIVGADVDDGIGYDSGSAYIFKRDGTSWIQQQKLTASDAATNDNFGISVSISGHRAFVGAPYDDDMGNGSGSAYFFSLFCPRTDLTDDCKVDFADFAIFAGDWLYGTN